jgi:hypothetical protein
MRKRRAAAVCAVVLAAGVAVHAQPAQAAPEVPAVISAAEVAAVQDFAQRNPDRYAGVYLDRARGTLRVYLQRDRVSSAATDLSRFAADAGASRAAGGAGTFRLAIVPVERNLRELNQVMAAVETREPFASLVRDTLSVWHVDPATSRVRIGLTTVTPAARAAAVEAFGDAVELVPADRQRTMSSKRLAPQGLKIAALRSAPLRAQQAAVPNRRLDAVPYYGATRMVRTWVQDGKTWVGECTVSYQVYVNGGSTRNQTTAGHCAPTGTVWQQGYFDVPTSTIRTTGPMGTMSSVQWGNNRMDAATVSGGSYWVGAVYTGSNFSELSLGVAGSQAVVVGDSICTNGSTTGSNCNGSVSSINTCLNLNDHGTVVRVCNQAIARPFGGHNTTLVQPGDSGGPVHKLAPGNPNRVLAVGIISGGNDTGTQVNFTQWQNVQSTFGVTVGVGNPA